MKKTLKFYASKVYYVTSRSCNFKVVPTKDDDYQATLAMVSRGNAQRNFIPVVLDAPMPYTKVVTTMNGVKYSVISVREKDHIEANFEGGTVIGKVDTPVGVALDVELKPARNRKRLYSIVSYVAHKPKISFSISNYKLECMINGNKKPKLTVKLDMDIELVKKKLKRIQNPFGKIVTVSQEKLLSRLYLENVEQFLHAKSVLK